MVMNAFVSNPLNCTFRVIVKFLVIALTYGRFDCIVLRLDLEFYNISLEG